MLLLITNPLCIMFTYSQLLDHKFTYSHLLVVQMKLITPAGLIERLKITGSLARAALKQMEAEGKITLLQSHHAQMIYTRNTGGD